MIEAATKDPMLAWAHARLDALRLPRPSRWMYLARAAQMAERNQLDDALMLALAAERVPTGNAFRVEGANTMGIKAVWHPDRRHWSAAVLDVQAGKHAVTVWAETEHEAVRRAEIVRDALNADAGGAQ